jgi:hypothetical protein
VPGLTSQEYLLTLLAKPREWSETSSEQASEEGGFMKNPQKSFASFMVGRCMPDV